MKVSRFGSDSGRLVFYFHGAPGAPEECEVFDAFGIDSGLRIVCFDRFKADSSLMGDAYYRYLADEILRQAGGEKFDVVGFSVGGFIALQACRYLKGEVRSLHLVSAAAPLEAGDFIEQMAGRQVFRLARSFPRVFALLSYSQGMLARLFPRALLRMLFASATSGDKSLADDPEFLSFITRILRSCFVGGLQGYVRDVEAYVRPWAHTLERVSEDVYVWHGAEDNWSPISMAEYFKTAIPGCQCVEIMEGLSHYSCLHQAAPKICQLLAKD